MAKDKKGKKKKSAVDPMTPEEKEQALKDADKVIEEKGVSVDAEEAFSKGWLLILTVTKWGATSRLEDGRIPDGLPTEIFKAIQSLLDKRGRRRLKQLNSIKSAARSLIKRNSLNFRIPGFDFVKKARLAYVNEQLKVLQTQYGEVVEDFLVAYPELKERYSKSFPEHYRPEKYPTDAKLRSVFRFYWSFKRFERPDRELENVDPDLYLQEQEQWRRDIRELQQTALEVTKKELLDRAKALAKQCESGKINKATVSGFTDFFSRFEDMYSDFIDSKQIKKAMDEVREYMEDTDADMLRYSDDFREAVGEQMVKVASTLEKIEDKDSVRQFDF